MTSVTDLFLRKGADRRLRGGHLWVYSNEVDAGATPLGGFEPGQAVVAGDLLLALDAGDYRDALAEAAAQLDQERRNIERDRELLVLLHEYGHCLMCRRVGGEADDEMGRLDTRGEGVAAVGLLDEALRGQRGVADHEVARDQRHLDRDLPLAVELLAAATRFGRIVILSLRAVLLDPADAIEHTLRVAVGRIHHHGVHLGLDQRLRPLELGIAHAHLREALDYTLVIPNHETGIRRFLIWAALLAVSTLRKIDANPLFASGAQVKVSRRRVAAIVATSNVVIRSNFGLGALFSAAARGLPQNDGNGSSTDVKRKQASQ